MLLGRRRLRDLGPLDWFAWAIGCLAVVMNLVALFGWRASVEASRTSRLILLLIGAVLLVWGVQRMIREARRLGAADQDAPAKQMLLLSLSMTCGALSVLLGPR
jgi:threonine/homoserine/homoserine lactone efflux protein